MKVLVFVGPCGTRHGAVLNALLHTVLQIEREFHSSAPTLLGFCAVAWLFFLGVIMSAAVEAFEAFHNAMAAPDAFEGAARC